MKKASPCLRYVGGYLYCYFSHLTCQTQLSTRPWERMTISAMSFQRIKKPANRQQLSLLDDGGFSAA
ncbi:hypothetical protein SAMN04488142_3033 [Halomonas sp. hl-4]|nr:hypothetical protein SAMN04488142_3033 [Halomonas sp. hl-4]